MPRCFFEHEFRPAEQVLLPGEPTDSDKAFSTRWLTCCWSVSGGACARRGRTSGVAASVPKAGAKAHNLAAASAFEEATSRPRTSAPPRHAVCALHRSTSSAAAAIVARVGMTGCSFFSFCSFCSSSSSSLSSSSSSLLSSSSDEISPNVNCSRARGA